MFIFNIKSKNNFNKVTWTTSFKKLINFYKMNNIIQQEIIKTNKRPKTLRNILINKITLQKQQLNVEILLLMNILIEVC